MFILIRKEMPYVLSDRTKYDEKSLAIRAFTEAQKRRAYERQNHKCPCCVKNGIDTEYAYNEMQGDHIIPWSQGGRTIDSNLQMLCQKCKIKGNSPYYDIGGDFLCVILK